MNDYISRQAAISAICNACGKIDCDKMDKCEKLQLPSADVVPYSIEPDGTLTVTVPKGTKRIGRILIEEDGTQYGGMFYPDTGGCFLSSMERSEKDGQKDNHRCIKALYG